jgi:hypothetical protein
MYAGVSLAEVFEVDGTSIGAINDEEERPSRAATSEEWWMMALLPDDLNGIIGW